MHILSNVKLYLEEVEDDKDEHGADFSTQKKNELNKIYWGEGEDFLGKFLHQLRNSFQICLQQCKER